MYPKCVNDVSYNYCFMDKHWFKYDIFVWKQMDRVKNGHFFKTQT